jgi:hypothetical protein
MKVTYSNDLGYQHWNLELTTKNEEEFDRIAKFILDELDYYDVEIVGCPTENADGYYDSFAIEKCQGSKAEVMKAFRGVVKKFRKINKNK